MGSLPMCICTCDNASVSYFNIASFLTIVANTVSISFNISYCCYVTLREAVEPGKRGWSATGTSLYCVIRLVFVESAGS